MRVASLARLAPCVALLICIIGASQAAERKSDVDYEPSEDGGSGNQQMFYMPDTVHASSHAPDRLQDPAREGA
jgi:hypothetical protein